MRILLYPTTLLNSRLSNQRWRVGVDGIFKVEAGQHVDSKNVRTLEFYKENAIDIGKVTWIEEPADVDSIVLNKTEVLVIELAKTRLNGKMLKAYVTAKVPLQVGS